MQRIIAAVLVCSIVSTIFIVVWVSFAKSDKANDNVTLSVGGDTKEVNTDNSKLPAWNPGPHIPNDAKDLEDLTAQDESASADAMEKILLSIDETRAELQTARALFGDKEEELRQLQKECFRLNFEEGIFELLEIGEEFEPNPDDVAIQLRYLDRTTPVGLRLTEGDFPEYDEARRERERLRDQLDGLEVELKRLRDEKKGSLKR